MSLHKNPEELLHWSWPQIEPHYQALAARGLTAENVAEWLTDWSRLSERVFEKKHRLSVATTVNPADADAERRYTGYLDELYPLAQAAEQKLKEKLLASGLKPDSFEVPLRNMRAEVA